MRKILLVLAILVLLPSHAALAAQLVMDGSTTMLPFVLEAVEQFMKVNPDVSISVSGNGTVNGFKALADGSAQIANVSSFMNDSELEMCMDNNVDPVPFAVALDCLVPIIHTSNPVTNLTRAQLKDIYAGKITNWKDIGGDDRPIVVVRRETSSGSYKMWQKIVMDDGGKTCVTPLAQVSASSGAMQSAVTNNRNAIGYEGMGYVTKAVRSVTVDGVKATAQNARNGQYPLARFLHMFTNGWPSGTARYFMEFMLSRAGQEIVADKGFIPEMDI